MKLELNEDRFAELVKEMWRGDVGSAGPSSRILMDRKTGELELRNEPGSLHSWYVPNMITLSSRDSGTSEDEMEDGDSIQDMIDYANHLIDISGLDEEVES